MTRNLKPDARVMVFADGQNVFKACRSNYEHGYVHPLLLAHRVRKGRSLCGVRYYSGLHDPRINPSMHAAASRRHSLMRRVGVEVVERRLRYRWEWGVNREDARRLPQDPKGHAGNGSRKVRVEPYQRPREKGIDLTLGLDVVDLALEGKFDVAVILSSDTDLVEVARMVHRMTKAKGERLSVEAAVFNESKKPIRMRHYDYTHQLKRSDFEEARDSFNYTREIPQVWKAAFIKSCVPLSPQQADVKPVGAAVEMV